jgi:putative oxidoreductase
MALEKLSWLWPLLVRLTVGLLFVSTGWTAVRSLDEVTAFFVVLHIPAAGFFAVLVSFTELVCGLLLVLGLGARLAAVPLIVTMTVAILTAKIGKIHGVPDLLRQIEFLYIVMLVAIVIAGPGAVSIDRYLVRHQSTLRSS